VDKKELRTQPQAYVPAAQVFAPTDLLLCYCSYFILRFVLFV